MGQRYLQCHTFLVFLPSAHRCSTDRALRILSRFGGGDGCARTRTSGRLTPACLTRTKPGARRADSRSLVLLPIRCSSGLNYAPVETASRSSRVNNSITIRRPNTPGIGALSGEFFRFFGVVIPSPDGIRSASLPRHPAPAAPARRRSYRTLSRSTRAVPSAVIHVDIRFTPDGSGGCTVQRSGECGYSTIVHRSSTGSRGGAGVGRRLDRSRPGPESRFRRPSVTIGSSSETERRAINVDNRPVYPSGDRRSRIHRSGPTPPVSGRPPRRHRYTRIDSSIDDPTTRTRIGSRSGTDDRRTVRGHLDRDQRSRRSSGPDRSSRWWRSACRSPSPLVLARAVTDRNVEIYRVTPFFG